MSKEQLTTPRCDFEVKSDEFTIEAATLEELRTQTDAYLSLQPDTCDKYTLIGALLRFTS